jgi:hypothetical protein
VASHKLSRAEVVAIAGSGILRSLSVQPQPKRETIGRGYDAPRRRQTRLCVGHAKKKLGARCAGSLAARREDNPTAEAGHAAAGWSPVRLTRLRRSALSTGSSGLRDDADGPGFLEDRPANITERGDLSFSCFLFDVTMRQALVGEVAFDDLAVLDEAVGLTP